MKKILLFTIAIGFGLTSFGQQQIGNSNMEAWANNNEPDNWNCFLTASGTWSGFAGDQCDASSDVRPGTTGVKSARIWARDASLALANGNLTLGQINMGSTSPSGSGNYNISRTANPDFSETLTDSPDSVVFWIKTGNGINGQARVKATLHDSYDYRDPEDAASTSHVVATAVLNFSPTTSWTRMAVPFNYSGPASNQTHILVTFSTNAVAGGGSVNDDLYIDDIELIYNSSAGIENIKDNGIKVSMNNELNEIQLFSKEAVSGEYAVYNSLGQEVQKGEVDYKIPFNRESGIYFVKIVTDKGQFNFEIVKF